MFFTKCTGNKTCAGGTNPGKSCTLDTDCHPDGTFCRGDGQCTASQRDDTVLGWQGYCLERDTGTSINGNPEQFACLTWYPIDQIPGAPDIFNNYPEAGFFKQNVHLCASADLYTNKKAHPEGDYHCAVLGWMSPDSCSSNIDEQTDQTVEYCLEPAIDEALEITPVNPTWGSQDPIECSQDEWIVMGNCGGNLNPTRCDRVSYDNDCPYHCVPQNSWHKDTGLPCSLGELGMVGTRGVQEVASYQDYSYIIFSHDGYSPDRLADCVKEGVPALSHLTDLRGDRISTLSPGSSPEYFGCKNVVKVSGNIDSNKAWTNRAWEAPDPAVPYRIIFDSAADPVRSYLAYVYNVLPKPFGNTINIPGNNFFSIPTCRRSAASGSIKLPTLDLSNARDGGLTCETGFTLDQETLPAGATTGIAVPWEARPYAMDLGAQAPAGASCATDADCNARIICAAVVCSLSCVAHTDCASIGADSRCVDNVCAGSDLLVTDYPGGGDYTPTRFSDYRGGYTIHCPHGWTTLRGRCVQDERIMRPTQYCVSNDTCRNMFCRAGACYTRGAVAIGSAFTEADPTAKAKQRISQIFAKVYTRGVTWDTAASNAPGLFVGKYEAGYLSSAWDITPKDGAAPGGEGWPAPPSIWAITNCTGNKCRPGTADTVTVGGIDGNGLTSAGSEEPENVVGYGGEYRATMQFFGTADKNTGPITAVTVDWGDRGDQSGSRNARYKNHLGLDACNNSDFAHSTDACTEDYFQFTHTYKCSEGGVGRDICASDTDTECYAENSCPENVNGGLDGNGSCCVFKPRVQLKDNWGWCNGTCPGRAHGCYDASPAGTNECNPADSRFDHWTSFTGRVIVVPK